MALADAEEHPIPEKAVREAVRELGETGKIRKLRSRKTGRELLAPVERMTERELETLLIGVMADPRSGIRVPEGSKLSRRVEGVRKERAVRESGPSGRSRHRRDDGDENQVVLSTPVCSPRRPSSARCTISRDGTRTGWSSRGAKGKSVATPTTRCVRPV